MALCLLADAAAWKVEGDATEPHQLGLGAQC